ncbi:MAG: ATP-binding protein, partial [Flavobacteriales bacterium]
KNIRAMSSMLKEQDSGPDGIAPRIESGTARMLDLVDDLLRFALTNKTQVSRETVELRGIVEEVIAGNVPAEQRERISVDIAEGVTAPVDRAMLKVLFVNLIGNALKFSRERTDAHVRVCHERELEAHHLWVSDNGIGFDSASGVDIFGAFKRLHRTDKFEGSGVGLSIVQRIVKKHGGETWAESSPGQGCTIHFRIPSEIPKDSALPFEERA